MYFPNKIKENELGMHCYLNTLPTSSFPVGFGFGFFFPKKYNLIIYIYLGGNAEN